MGNKIVPVPKKLSQTATLGGLSFDAENDIILLDVVKRFSGVEGDAEVIAWANGTIGRRDADDFRGRRHYAQEREYNGGDGD